MREVRVMAGQPGASLVASLLGVDRLKPTAIAEHDGSAALFSGPNMKSWGELRVRLEVVRQRDPSSVDLETDAPCAHPRQQARCSYFKESSRCLAAA